MSIVLTTLVPALLPAVSDGLRGIFARITGGKGALPANVDEVIRLTDSEVRKLEAIAKLDTPVGEIYKWAATARALQRPAIATLIIVLYAGALLGTGVPETALLALGDYVSMVTFYLFGDRTYSFVKGARR